MPRSPRPELADIALSDEAIEWMVRLHSGRSPPEERGAFTRWRAQSAAHEAAAAEAEALWHGLGSAGAGLRAERRASRARITRRAVLGTGALAALGLAGAGTGLWPGGPRADYATSVNETREITLADGSRVLLNASSALAVDFSPATRRLTLIAGQALFTVTPDAARPFIVGAADGWTRAVGTQFDVDIRREATVVTVLEGQVSVGVQGPLPAVTLLANETVRYGAGTLGRPTAIDAAHATSWRRGKLIFDRRPLADVVGELQRHTRTRLVIASGSVGALEVTGVFDLNDPLSVLDTIEQTLPVRVVRLPFVSLIL
ncbi:putative iron siderophore sensor protein [Azorhizobium caulinodans ORS 571]|uniref:Putative iron siderophore sensor protein n=1 Tax=Azorhizobium caulinodans (strain ATCC 43989 / DSM 5975 / JCM 20966 / LMG 6465 / NBRC 14845 / NCIMB 13405 / ORS 571) TaxID=438753 RepID=A8HWH5_AZOC5|nr:FecR family protein [Azorhizobium caulinodans]BAF90430.1 putative iron siderophore sensor protein [Azorhizobium caulinodans ORS 571]